MAAPAYPKRKRSGGRAAMLLAAAVLLAAGGYSLWTSDIADLGRRLFGAGAEVDLAGAPAPRVAAPAPQTPGGSADAPLTPMPAAVNDDSGNGD
ncbi:MAG TPA: hypothetical protein VHE77_22700, partial [Dongiaceae bacterium]|nr:hypothetical protein [Dongiaceae bacterium]